MFAVFSKITAMRNVLISVAAALLLTLTSPLNPFQNFYDPVKEGCLDEEAINYCYDCNVKGGSCLYDNELSRRCEDTIVKWKRRWRADGEWATTWRITTYEECWQEWRVSIYNELGDELWTSDDPNDEWDGTIGGEKIEAGEYYVSIEGKTRGMTKIIDILTEIKVILSQD